MAENTKSLVGETIHFFGSKTVLLGESFGADSVVTDYGTEIVVTQAVLDASINRKGRSWLSLVDDPVEQVKRWGKVMFARGPWPQDRPRLEVGSVKWDRARREALSKAAQIADPVERVERLREVKAHFGKPGDEDARTQMALARAMVAGEL